MVLKAFYVLVSRVTAENGLRALESNKEEIANLPKMQHDPNHAAWEQGYDDNGFWNDALCRNAFATIEKAQHCRKAAKESKHAAPTTRGQKRAREVNTDIALASSETAQGRSLAALKSKRATPFTRRNKHAREE